MLKDFYTLHDQSGPETEITAAGITRAHYKLSVELNPDHPVYGGHFPGSPVVPGVCQIMMIQELISALKEKSLKLEHADTIKFLSLIIPGKNPVLDFDVSLHDTEEGRVSANVIIHEKEVIFLKFKGTFTIL